MPRESRLRRRLAQRPVSFQTPLDGRLFTLSQGQLDVHFPPGFGLPVMSNEIIDLSTQVLNLNVQDRSLDVRHKVDVEFVRDAAVARPMKPLYERALMGMVSLEDRGLIPDKLLDVAGGNHAEHAHTHDNQVSHGRACRAVCPA